jgi:hypothetical protein
MLLISQKWIYRAIFGDLSQVLLDNEKKSDSGTNSFREWSWFSSK